MLLTVAFCPAIPRLVLAAPPADAPGVNLRRTVAVEVAERTKDAVVFIASTVNVRQQRRGFDPFWGPFDQGPTIVPANSLGSGFLVHEQGYLVTNNHVIDRARQITVELSDGRKLPATVVSADPEVDLAVLKISDPKPFPVIQLGDSSDLMIGEPAIAVGNPVGLSHTVSTGIISALHRDLRGAAPGQERQGGTLLKDLIQTDAAINHGNSGGPLLNAYGQVIGINTAVRSDAQNIGFAIGVNRLRDLIPELMNPAAATRVKVPIRLMEKRTLAEPATVSPTVVEADHPDHVVKSINGRTPRDIIDAYAVLLKSRPGDAVTVQYADGSKQSVKASAMPQPDAVVQAKNRLGVTIEQVTPMLSEKYHLRDLEDGLLVTEVVKDPPAASLGLQPGDVIVALGRSRTSNLDQLAAVLAAIPERARVTITVVREGELMNGPIVLGARDAD
jgi:serine protease Do